MEILLPRPSGSAAADPYDFYRLPDPHRPWLRVNMISTIDGSVTDARGLSGGLGGTGDRAAFRALRALADVVLVGAGTVRAEGYGPYHVHHSVAERRRADHRPEPAPIVVVSESLRLDVDAALFTEAVTPTIVLTSAASPGPLRARLHEVAEVIVVGERRVDLTAGLQELRLRGFHHIVCEGGPTLNTRLLAAGLVDELCVTFAPRLLGRDATRIISAAGGTATADLVLHGVAREHDELFLRYLVMSREAHPRTRDPLAADPLSPDPMAPRPPDGLRAGGPRPGGPPTGGPPTRRPRRPG